MDQPQAAIRLTSGITGSGKTHFSLKLQRMGWVRFSLDEYMLALYGPSSSLDEWLHRDKIIFSYLTPIAQQLLQLGQGIIFDWSSESKALRQPFITLANSMNVALIIDAFEINEELAWKRIQQRNAEDNAYPVDKEIFETSIAQWQAPTEDEAKIIWHKSGSM